MSPRVAMPRVGRLLPGRSGRRSQTSCHAPAETWFSMGVMLSAAGSLSWLAGVTGGARSELWLRILAGGWVVGGVWRDASETVAACVGVRDVVERDPDWVRTYDAV